MMTLKLFPSQIYFCLILLLCIKPAAGQEKTGNVAARVVDENNTVLPYVQAIVKRSTDSVTLKSVLANESGQIVFHLPEGSYFIELKMMGYETSKSGTFKILQGQTTSLGSIQLRPGTKLLQTVNISATPPFVERRADKLIVNLNGLGSGAPILEVMNQLPGVVVSPTDQLSLNGKSVQVYIDGKASTLSAEALSGLLKGMSSSAIQKVELISQPPAKYDAAGNGAIINIIRKRNYKAGLSGNVYVGAGKGTFGKANSGINLNYKGKAYNILLNLDYNYNKYFYNSNITSAVYNGALLQAMSVSAISSTRSNANYTPGMAADFYLTKRTTVSATVKPGFQNFQRDGQANLYTNQREAVAVQSEFINLVNIRSNNLSAGLRLQHLIDTAGREFTADLDYYRYGNYNHQNNSTNSVNPRVELPSRLQQDRVFDVYAFKMDYSHPLKKGRELEMGLKTSLVNSINSNMYNDQMMSQINLFDYKESISALYLTYGRTGKMFSYQLGSRAEYTYGKGMQELNINHFSRNYFQLFPSLHLDYKFTASHTLSLGLNKRIERPGYESLNPLVRIISSNNLQQGNIDLKPLIAYNADLWYGYKNAFFVGLTYSYSLDDFTSISKALAEGVFTTLPGNADHADYFTFQAMYGKQVLPWWYTSSNTIVSKRSFKGEFNGFMLESNGIYSLSATSYNSFSLSKNFSVMFLFNYRGKSQDRTITNQAFAYLTAGLRQQFLNKRASAQFNVMDIFRSYRNYYQQNSGAVQQTWRNQFETRMFKINLNYNFGGTIKNAKKTAIADEEKKRSTVNEN